MRTTQILLASALLALPGMARAQEPCNSPNLPLRAIASTHTNPPYPQLSLMTKEEGRTLLRVSIDKTGAVTDAQVETSSGSLRLDQAAIDHVKANWRWEPPLRNCQPAEAQTRVSIVWNLNGGGPSGLHLSDNPVAMLRMITFQTADPADYPPDALAAKAKGYAGLLVMLNDAGQVQDAKVAVSSGSPSLDAKSLELVKTRYHWTSAQLNGKPVGGLQVVMLFWTLPGEKALQPEDMKKMLEMLMASPGANSGAAPPPPVTPAPPR